MAEIKWTDEQLQAIEEKGKNLLVSAAAGSGKTAVLVERIRRIIIEEKTDIDRLLVVTFTNAAAAEMKEKILKALYKEVGSAKGSVEDAQFLRRQIELISDADISTFHSFGLRIIRENFQLTDLRPDFKIADEGDLTILRKEVMDELFSEMYEKMHDEMHVEMHEEMQEEKSEGSFTDFLNAYSSDRSDDALKQELISCYIRIMNIPEPFEWLDEKTDAHDRIALELTEGKLSERLRACVVSKLKEALSAFEAAQAIVEERGLEKLSLKCRQDTEAVENILLCTELSDISSAVNSFSAVRMVASKDEKEDWEDIKEGVKVYREFGKAAIKYLKNRYFLFSFEEYIEDISSTAPAARMFTSLMKGFHRLYKAAKAEKNIIEFNDIEHYVLQILEDENVCSMYREKYRYIFVDEYQDSNILQEALLSRICSSDNMFMVGDIKQSIYKFRLAEPEIFRDKYERFRKDETGLNMKLDLNMNFRSKLPVINAVNGIFETAMDGYDDAASLKAGDTYDGEYLPEAELCLVDTEKDDDLPEEISELKYAELEAYACCEYIRGLLGTVFHDSKEGRDRKISYRDIVILTNSVKSVSEKYARVFSEQGIPVFMDTSAGYFDTVEVEVFLNLLRIIDNSMQDVPLVSVLNSVIGGFTIDEITEIRLYDRALPYYSVIRMYAENEDNELSEKCGRFLRRINEYSLMAAGIPLDIMIWRLLMETGYFSYIGALPGGNQRQANLRALIDKAVAFQARSGGGIYEFLTYVDAVNKVVDIGQAKLLSEQDDVVRIMTIHKSKGLEFPAVIVTGLGKSLTRRYGKNGRITLHKDIGFGLSRVNYEEMWYRKTLLQHITEETEKAEELDEKIRVLYVALTRARDHLIMIGSVKGAMEELERFGMSDSVVAAKSYVEYIAPCADAAELKVKIFNRAGVSEKTEVSDSRAELDRRLFGDDIAAAYRKREDEALKREIGRRLSFSYPYMDECEKKSKYSVSEIYRDKGKLTEGKVALNTPLFMTDEKDMTAAERGNVYHLIMENISFADAATAGDADYISSYICKMVSEGKLTEEQSEIADPEKIVKFFDTELGRRASLAESLGRKKTEESFNIMREIDGVPVMVQGIIDCFFEEDDGYVVIDYKSNHLRERYLLEDIERLKEMYSGQVEIYIDAVEKTRGKPVKEAWLYLFDKAVCVKMDK